MSVPAGYGIEPETATERAIVADADWRAGMAWAGHGRGHPEARVGDHVREVLANVDREAADPAQRGRLRLVALLHDAAKHRVRWWIPGRGDHAKLAGRLAARFVADPGVLTVIVRHDDAYRAWRRARRTGRWARAQATADELAQALGDELPLFLAFYRCDNETGAKASDDRDWFQARIRAAAAHD